MTGLRSGKQWFLTIGLMTVAQSAMAGAYIFAGEEYGIDLILHPQGYTEAGGQLELNVCITPGTANEVAMKQSVLNIIGVYNQLLPTTGNVKPSFLTDNPIPIDFESVALHELGHCLGKAHVNAASESGLGSPDIESTKAADGVDDDVENNTPTDLNTNAGVDGVMGSSDDVRGDDINLHWFRTVNNNPFTIDYARVDSTTYAVDTSSLPTGHLFATNGDRTVGADLLSTPNTEAVMQQGTFYRERQRTLAPDGVATLRYAMSGVDEIEDSSDDYTIHLNFIETTTDCDLQFHFATGVGLAYCSVGGRSITSDHWKITSANMYFGEEYNWFFNTDVPCNESFTLVQNQWQMFTPGCSLGISTIATVAEALGDDHTGAYLSTWVVYEWDAANGVYHKLVSTDELETGRGYWIYSTEADHLVDLEGQFNGAPDILLSGSVTGRQNLIGHPFDYSVKWEDVQIIDDDDDGAGPEVEVIRTLADAVSEGLVDVTFHKRECGTYEPYDIDGFGMVGYLNPSDGIWVKAYDDGIRLRVPAIEATAPTPDPCPAAATLVNEVTSAVYAESAALEFVRTTEVVEAETESEYVIENDGSWYARIIVESGKYRDKGNVFGQRPGALKGQDPRDLEELAPFGDTYLTVVFPHEDWDPEPWAYTTDFHPTTKKPQGEWIFAVHSSVDLEEIGMRLEGPESILMKGKLRDLETGKQVKFRDGIYTFAASPGVKYFRFTLGKK